MKKLFTCLLCLLFVGSLNAQVVINPCAALSDIHIVVLGSSTAAGAGPTSPDSAWVNRYRKYMQEINPNNQVTNLGVGGTTTYQIMPDWYVPPAGRPNPTPTKNVSQAVSLGADAIIVNMPSNDASNNFNTTDQMFNFRTIRDVADSAGIPVWICTTQPRNGFSASQIQIQTDVRDSVLVQFAPRTLDFWGNFANANNGLATQWDSGDGVHMNNAAHGELNQTVINAGIPNAVPDTLNYVDHVLASIWLENPVSSCGDSITIVKVSLGNLGAAAAMATSVDFLITDNITMSANTQNVSLTSGLGSCVTDTLSIQLNTYTQTDIDIKAYVLSGDTDLSNDSSAVINVITTGHPSLTVMNDTVPSGSTAILTATTAASDTVLWYDAPNAGNLIAGGPQFSISNLTADQTLYAEAVRGPLHFANSLFTTANTTTNWNGMMFDIVAAQDIVIDSFKIKVESTGPQNVVAYYRNGSLVGNEMNSSLWTTWGVDAVNASTAGTFHVLDYSDLNLQTNDTLGVYLHLQNGSSNLSYLNSGATTYSNADVQVLNGTGVTHTFGTTYSPRNWSGEVFYHYGFNPQGDCASERFPVSGIVQWPVMNENYTDLDIDILPNPSTGRLLFVGDIVPKKVQVYNMQSQLMQSVELLNNSMNISDLASGLYLLSFEIHGKTFVRKIQKN